MDAKRLVIGTLAGALTLSATGYVIFGMVGISNVGNLTGAVTDPLLELVPGAIAGGVIASCSGRSDSVAHTTKVG